MIGSGISYFTNVYDPKCHFIITGRVNDIYCSDRLAVHNFEMELHDHLLSVGYDAVIFFDIHNTMYTFDHTSSFYMMNGYLEETTQNVQQTAPTQSKRPGGGGSSVFSSSAPAASSSSAGGSTNMGRMHEQSAWNGAVELLRNPDVSTAFVFNTIDSLHGHNLTDSHAFSHLIYALESLASVQQNDASKPQSSAFYLFREKSICQFSDTGNQLHGSGSGWITLYKNVLEPRIITPDNPENNRVIIVPPPNAAEIRNYLNYLRLRSNDTINIDPLEIEELSIRLAHYCSLRNRGLSDIKNEISNYYREHNDRPIRADDWRVITGETNYVPAIEKLNSFIGMENVKRKINELRVSYSNYSADVMPEHSGRLTPFRNNPKIKGNSLNLVFKGPAGTGKTTVARLMGEIYYDLGLLPQGKVVYTIGTEIDTPEKMSQYFQDAIGGVLIIDEAYGLMQGYYSNAVITQLVGNITIYEGQISVILAGYPNQINELFRLNEGLHRRFPGNDCVYEFEDYTPDEMHRIILQLADNYSQDNDRIEFRPEFREILPCFCENWTKHNGMKWGNGGEAEELLKSMRNRYRTRLTENGIAFDGVYRLGADDLPDEFRDFTRRPAENLTELYTQLNSMIGLHSVKQFLKGLADRLILQSDHIDPGKYIFHGPPGTGKTTTVEKMCEMLFLLKVIKRRKFVKRTAGELMMDNPEHDPRQNLRKAVEEARQSVLFIDEAHQLLTSAAGRAIISELITQIEDPDIRYDTGFILAGYTVEMQDFLNYDPGMSRRFPENCRLRFENYTGEELTQILSSMLKKRGEIPDEDYLRRSRIALDRYLENNQSNDNFGNGGFIRDNYIPMSIKQRAERLKNKYGKVVDGETILEASDAVSIPAEEKRTLTGADLPENMIAYAGSPGAPIQPVRTAEARLGELYGKDELVKYIKGMKAAEDSVVYMDDSAGRNLNFIITGSPGSGRKTAAKVMAEVWKEYGFLERRHIRFAGKGDLEAGYVGQTAPKTAAVISSCLDGTLVIVNPSALVSRNDHDNTFGPEAVGVISSAMTEYSDRLSVIFIDTEDGMKEFLKGFPDIRSKCSREFVFEDLSPKEMQSVFELSTKDSYAFTDELNDVMDDFFINWVSDRGGIKGDAINSWGNGTEVTKLIGDLKTAWSNNNGENVMRNNMPHRLITKEMFPSRMMKYLKSESSVSEDAIKELDSYPGLDGVQESLRKIRRRIKYMDRSTVTPGLYCYIGNPGTGKTTVARIMGKVLRASGVLSQGHLIMRTAREIAERPVDFDKLIKLARNGILFIDEAHQLASFSNGRDIIKRLLTVIEDVEVMRDTCIILAGYPAEMAHLMEVDSGLKSRFGTADSMIMFRNYTPEELLMIAERMTSRANEYEQISCSFPLEMSEGFREDSMRVFRMICGSGDNDFGNARFVRNYIHDAVSELLERVERENEGEEIDMASHNVLQKEDIPSRYRKMLDKTEMPAIIAPSKVHTARRNSISDNDLTGFCRKISPAVVYLEITENGHKAGSGTGFLVSDDGYILTCEHVGAHQNIRARLKIEGLPGGDIFWKECRVLRPLHKDCDMALLKIEGSNYPYVNIRPFTSAISDTERTLIIGYPLGERVADDSLLEPNKFLGRVSSRQILSNGITRFMIGSEGKKGNSGSPVISLEDGCVIGVFSGAVTSEGDYKEEINYFMPITYFWERFVSLSNGNNRMEEKNE